MSVFFCVWSILTSFLVTADRPVHGVSPPQISIASTSPSLACNCTISQGGNTFPISALMGNETAVQFYSYGNPAGTSANTGLEINNTLILFLYEDINTGIVSLFLINDISNSGSGGSVDFEITCLPLTSFISVSDDPGEFTGAPPIIIGDWNFSSGTDGGVVENVGCNTTFSLDLLAGNGIDNILWLSGNINAPTQIPINMNGDIITINCGPGICCPVGFDTDVIATNAICLGVPNGSIDLEPNDGIPPYSFAWSNGENTEDLVNILPGNYTVTITDNQGCEEILTVMVGLSMGNPQAAPASLTVCSETPEFVFDLTTLNSIVNLNMGLNVLWFENPDMNDPISNPTNFLSGSTIVYAFVDNNGCFSDEVAVELEVVLSPAGIATTLNACEDENGMAVFDLSSLEALVSGGSGTVEWYMNIALSIPINDPADFLSGSTTVYAVVTNGTCDSEPVEVELIVDLQPIGNMAAMNQCGNPFDIAIFDLTLLDLEISNGNGDVEWFVDIDLSQSINNPTAFLSPTQTVYAAVFDGICYSDPIPVFLIVDPTPNANPVTVEQCDDGTGMALFNLWDYANLVSAGAGGVDWYFDIQLQDQIPDPDEFYTPPIVIYATVDDGTCVSDPVAITLSVLQTPVGNPSILETCADSTGQGLFDLTTANNAVSGGTGTVLWFEDAQGIVEITNPAMYQSFATTVYAQIAVGVCISASVPVSLVIINTVSASPAALAACDDGSGIAVFNLANIENAVSNGTGQVSWFIDASGLIPILTPGAFVSGDSIIYARVIAGDCVSEIVPITLSVLSSPVSSGTTIDLCGDANSQTVFDLTSLDTVIGGNPGLVTWYADTLLTMTISDPGNFTTGNTTVFAVISIGTCMSAPAPVTINVSTGLIANPDTVQLCIPAGDTLLYDLTQSDPIVSGGVGVVNWFSDPSALMPIISPGLLPVSMSSTIYAHVTDGNCVSPLVPVEIEVHAAPLANPVDIQRCGDANGQVSVDLTSYDTQISENTGAVAWYSDATLLSPILNTGSWSSGDTLLYAVVVNGFCETIPVAITLTVVDSLTANSIVIEGCDMNNNGATILLSEYANEISGGNGTVHWFMDMLATDTIDPLLSFVTNGELLYANVEADGCTSNLATVLITVTDAGFPVPTCMFTSVDSIAITWPSLGTQYSLTYTVNGQPIGSPVITSIPGFGLGGLNEGDVLMLSVTALYNDPCMPQVSTITCMTDVCPAVSLEFINLDPSYCRDQGYVLLDATPAGGQFSGTGVSGDTLYPALVSGGSTIVTYQLEDNITGCIYDRSQEVFIENPIATPELNCAESTLSSVEFSWNGNAIQFAYAYSINQGPLSGVVLSNEPFAIIDALVEGDEVTFQLWIPGPEPCGNSDTVSVTCATKVCEPVFIVCVDPGTLCSGDAPLNLEVIFGEPIETITWSGTGVIDPTGVFDPALAGPGVARVDVMVESDGCLYFSFLDIEIFAQPQATFDITGTPCIDSVLHVSFTGIASQSALFEWELDGATLVSGSFPLDFAIEWPGPGNYSLGLTIDDNGCISGTSNIAVQIDAPLDTPAITCIAEDYYSLMIEWEPVDGATGYVVTSSLGTGVVSGNTYTVRNLPDDTTVVITVVATGPSACGPSSSTVQCKTIKYIPVTYFVPNIFSPNGDNINDVLYIQSNSEIISVDAFRVFDRWGEVVYEKLNFPPNDQSHGWDGTFGGKTLNAGVFVYWAQVQTTRGIEVIVGDVTMLR